MARHCAGSGKSVLIQNLLIDIAATNDCRHAKIVLTDPKQGADYLDLQRLPHLQGEIIVTQDAAHAALEAAVTEMNVATSVSRRGRGQPGAIQRRGFPGRAIARVVDLSRRIRGLNAGRGLSRDRVEHGAAAGRDGPRGRHLFGVRGAAAGRPRDALQLRDNLGNRLVLRVESPGTSMIAFPHPSSPGGRGDLSPSGCSAAGTWRRGCKAKIAWPSPPPQRATADLARRADGGDCGGDSWLVVSGWWLAALLAAED